MSKNECKIEKVLDSLRQNNFRAAYVKDIKAARKKILQIIPEGTTVGIGDSVSVRQLMIIEELHTQGRVIINPFSKEISLLTTNGKISKNQRKVMLKLALSCEFFLTGTNALTQDGKLVNIDSAGNRVVGMIFGPKKVVIVVGRNKIVRDVEEAFYRVRNLIAPYHAKAKKRKTPCAITGKCTDCESPERICNVSTIIEKKPSHTDLTVLIVNEDLGLSWDDNWSSKRINKICSNYSELTWLKRPAWPD